MAELQPSRLPVDAVFFIGFTMTTIVVCHGSPYRSQLMIGA